MPWAWFLISRKIGRAIGHIYLRGRKGFPLPRAETFPSQQACHKVFTEGALFDEIR